MAPDPQVIADGHYNDIDFGWHQGYQAPSASHNSTIIFWDFLPETMNKSLKDFIYACLGLSVLTVTIVLSILFYFLVVWILKNKSKIWASIIQAPKKVWKALTDMFAEKKRELPRYNADIHQMNNIISNDQDVPSNPPPIYGAWLQQAVAEPQGQSARRPVPRAWSGGNGPYVGRASAIVVSNRWGSRS